MEKGTESYSNKGKVFITGNMNRRTSNLSDILDFDRYIENNDLFLDMSHIPSRSNKDKVLDSHYLLLDSSELSSIENFQVLPVNDSLIMHRYFLVL